MVSFPSCALPVAVPGRRLEPLLPEQPIWFQRQPGDVWRRAVIKETRSDRSYMLETPEGQQYVRNRRFIRPFRTGNDRPDPLDEDEQVELAPQDPDDDVVGGEPRRSRRQGGMQPGVLPLVVSRI